ncbi:MAG: sialate O-acetylesterase, partial [Planctomycetaceae bacterium]|nr:sialate O-acetylesterase [Planctomycetaceae bacterium]
LLGLGLALGCVGVTQAEVRLPTIFSDHMVLQRDQEIPVWGWADAGEKVTVHLGDAEQTTAADDQGNWSLKLASRAAGGPHELVVQGENRIAIDDVWIGEVWLCSGQSNMAMTVNRAKDFETEQAAAELPRIRQFKVAATYAAEPQTDCKGEWVICSPQTVGGISATAFFFAREIERELKAPVGIINSSVGGTPIDSWISEDAQRESPDLRELFSQIEASRKNFDAVKEAARYEAQLSKWKEAAKAARAAGTPVPRAPRDPVAQFEKKANCGGLYHGKVAPFIRYGFRGALWYQGEANSTPERAGWYQHQLPLLVNDWRTRHGGGEFPFAWVQLPNYRGAGRNWPLVREAMLQATSTPNTGVAVTIDVGETADIHPKNKQEVGRRLALWAEREVYGEKRVPPVPQYAGHSAEGGAIVVKLRPQIDSRLLIPNEADDLAFAAVAGEDRTWKPAKVEAATGNSLRFSSPEVSNPVAVRYLWANDPQVEVIRTAAGLPISPFRTDDWDVTQPFDE